jgi:hypothetical protein
MEPNTDITELRAFLRAKMDELSRKQAEAAAAGDLVTFQRLGLQILELEHRARMLGRIEFAEDSAALQAKLAPIEAAKGELDAAIEEIERFTAFVRSISKFLGLVDKVIDLLA